MRERERENERVGERMRERECSICEIKLSASACETTCDLICYRLA